MERFRMVNDDRLTAPSILEMAAARSPERVYALVSGGHDSATAMYVTHTMEGISLDGVLHLNTGVAIPATRQFVQERCRALDLEYIEIGSDYRYQTEAYRHLVQTYGFPGPAAHRWMYANLKEKPLQRWLTEHTDGEVILVSGVRKQESRRRMETIADDGIQRALGATWVSPLLEWSGLDVRRYRRAHDLPMNPVVGRLEYSGECLCGAFAHRDELGLIRLFYPDVWRYLQCLELQVLEAVDRTDVPPAYALWGHGRLRDHERAALVDDEQLTLCASCARRNTCEQSVPTSKGRERGYQTYAEAFLRDPVFDTCVSAQ